MIFRLYPFIPDFEYKFRHTKISYISKRLTLMSYRYYFITQIMKIKLPIKTVSEANLNREHWAKKHRRHKLQKEAIKLCCTGRITPDLLPCTIKLTRIAPRFLDSHDNLPCSFKFILDSLAALLVPGKANGQADSDKRIQVIYDQIKGVPHEYAIEIEIIPSSFREKNQQ